MQAVAAAAVKQLWRAQRHAHCNVDDFYYYMRRRKFPSFMTWSMIVCVGWMKMNFSRYYFGVGKSLYRVDWISKVETGLEPLFALYVSDMSKDFLVVHTAEGQKKLLDIFQRLFCSM